YLMQWNLNMEKQLGSWGITAGYVGARGVHLLQVERNMNTVMPTIVGSGLSARYFYPAVAKVASCTPQPNCVQTLKQTFLKLNPNFASINCTATFNSDTF